MIGLLTAACGDRNLDAIKAPPEDALGGTSSSVNAGSAGDSSGSGGTGGGHQHPSETGGWMGSAGDPGGSGGSAFGGTGGEHSHAGGAATGGRGTGGNWPNGGRGTGGAEASTGGHVNGGRNAGGTGGWVNSGGTGGTGGKYPYTGGSMGTGGGSDVPPSGCPPEGVPNNGDVCQRSFMKPCAYGNGPDTALCRCISQRWSCSWPCPPNPPISSSDCSSKEAATCRYDTGALCYCVPEESSWVCADATQPDAGAGAAGASGAGAEAGAAGALSGAGGDADASVPPSGCPDIEPWNWSYPRPCDEYARGTYCEYGPSWWCLCTGEYGWHCEVNPASQNTQAM